MHALKGKEDALNLPCLNILSEVNSPIIFIETKMLKSVQKDFVSINLIGWCTQCYCLVGIKFITGWNKMWCCNILWRILMQFFATKTSTKVLSHHPDYNDVLIFHIGIECASCARPQASDLNFTNKGFSQRENPLFVKLAFPESNKLEIASGKNQNIFN